ncbi:MAG TPA: DeoR/GlpR transcriptional regulator [Verrucomicrobiales bacterium]|nr:DeoR/GlpR transcriptional regulator [Verrucomicrobiales bacterium]HIL69344.1 DeoR/GlpR transcriptional regulator [Verrucomicrobiota bacterium]
MQAEERQNRISDYLNKVEYASLEELAKHVDVSVSTVRRDLDLLEAGGTVRRTHGGARITEPDSDEFIFSHRDTHQLEEKEAMGRLCSEIVEPGQSIIMDAGTTVFHAARHLDVHKKPQIITNSLPIANHFASSNLVEVVVSGGVVYPRLGVLVGPAAVRAMEEMHADIAIMSAAGITSEGITNSHGLLIDIQHAMIRAAGKVVFCIDHTKFNRKSLNRLCGLDEVHTLITDAQAPAKLIAQIKQAGVNVQVAKVE